MAVVTTIAAASSLIAVPAHAQHAGHGGGHGGGGGGHGGGGHGHGGGWHGGGWGWGGALAGAAILGAYSYPYFYDYADPYAGYPYGGYPYAGYPYASYPNAGYAYPSPSMAYTPAAPGAPGWYYCQNPAGYYPNVQQCPVPWQLVPVG